MAALSPAAGVARQPASSRLGALRRGIFRSPGLLVGIVGLALICLAAIFGPSVSPYGVDEEIGAAFQAPTVSHPLGTDSAGSDVLTRMLYGAQTSLVVGFAAALVATIVGVAVGVLAGYAGRSVDNVLMRTTDYFLAVPSLPLMILIAALWGANYASIILIIGLLSWAPTALLVRAQTRTLKERPFVVRVEAQGLSRRTIIGRHLLPHLLPLILATMVPAIGNAVFTEAGLSFLGLGDPTRPSWGLIMADAFSFGATSRGAWWTFVPPGLAIAAVVLATAIIGASLERLGNPKSEVSHLGRDSMRVSESI